MSRLGPITRPRDAAGLVLLRGLARDAQGDAAERGGEVLLGRRHRGARFMPGVFVPPGGGLDPQDRTPCPGEKPQEAEPRPLPGVDAESLRRLAAFKRCALREAWEETGVLVGKPLDGEPDHAGSPASGEPWASFRRAGLQPSLSDLRLIARAITPRASPIRFHTRFFLALDQTVIGPSEGDGELEDVAWVPLQALSELPMSPVTASVLGEAVAQARSLLAGKDRAPARFFYRRDIEGEVRRLWPEPESEAARDFRRLQA